MRLLVLLDAPERLNPATDTTLTIIDEARRRGHEVDTALIDELALDGPNVLARGRAVADYAAVLIRKDPPFDAEYYFATLLLERAREQTLLVNDPRGLRDANEKLYIFNFPSLIAPTKVVRSLADLKRALDDFDGEMIVKPLDGCGGHGVFHVRRDDRNTNAILETVSCDGTKLVMAQRYLAAARQGDKRILILDGEPIGAVLRVPRADEVRGNLHAGGRPERTELDARDREICATLKPRLVQDGLYFVGIDVIGGFLTEVNVTSPTGVREIDRLTGEHLEARVVDWVERKADSRRPTADS